MRLKNLETFVTVVKAGSFRAAAERLYTTQPAISARIAALEENLGVELFDRSKRQVSLKPKGLELLSYAECILKMNAEMELAIADRSSYSGLIRLGSSETLIHTWGPTFLDKVRQTYPKITIELEVDTTLGLRNSLANQEIDIAFLMGPVSEPSMRNRDLCSYPLVWVASPEMNLPDKPLSLSELAGYPMLSYPRKTMPYIALRDAFREASLPSVRIDCSSSLATIIHLATHGAGISVLPREVIEKPISSGELRIIEVDYDFPALEFTVTYPSSGMVPILDLLADMAVEIANN
ncbi:LysR family transcriptional regulator [Aestuariispira insulae]|uniref:LysR family transcriptional regulator n=1 Tax=Aestuariispira insulae TaxID=1461337 RepID=A0A3D9HKG9_9PROT|nr:LysR family transcriptional regulator [Aestuariispira insulae]RED49781.1 LysR family transcriptional regulator [Aestuariispira insulae]